MRKLLGSLLAVSAFCSQAHAAPTIIVNSGNIALPGYTTAAVFQDFGTNIRDGSLFIPNSTIKIVPNSGNPTESIKSPNKKDPVVVKNDAEEGMTGNYLSIGNGGRYTIDFSLPVAFFSFAFNEFEENNHLKITYANNITDVFNAKNIFGTTKDEPEFGRISFDVGSGARIKSVSFFSGDDEFNIDSIASAAPEPSTWAMMILGFGLMGAQLRRHRIRLPMTGRVRRS